MKSVCFLFFTLCIGFVFSQNRIKCEPNKIAYCHNEKIFSMCENGFLGTSGAFECPKGLICTGDETICAPKNLTTTESESTTQTATTVLQKVNAPEALRQYADYHYDSSDEEGSGSTESQNSETTPGYSNEHSEISTEATTDENSATTTEVSITNLNNHDQETSPEHSNEYETTTASYVSESSSGNRNEEPQTTYAPTSDEKEGYTTPAPEETTTASSVAEDPLTTTASYEDNSNESEAQTTVGPIQYDEEHQTTPSSTPGYEVEEHTTPHSLETTSESSTEPQEICGKCMSGDHSFACLNATTYVYCDGAGNFNMNEQGICGEGFVCDLHNQMKCSPAAEVKPSCQYGIFIVRPKVFEFTQGGHGGSIETTTAGYQQVTPTMDVIETSTGSVLHTEQTTSSYNDRDQYFTTPEPHYENEQSYTTSKPELETTTAISEEHSPTTESNLNEEDSTTIQPNEENHGTEEETTPNYNGEDNHQDEEVTTMSPEENFHDDATTQAPFEENTTLNSQGDDNNHEEATTLAPNGDYHGENNDDSTNPHKHQEHSENVEPTTEAPISEETTQISAEEDVSTENPHQSIETTTSNVHEEITTSNPQSEESTTPMPQNEGSSSHNEKVDEDEPSIGHESYEDESTTTTATPLPPSPSPGSICEGKTKDGYYAVESDPYCQRFVKCMWDGYRWNSYRMSCRNAGYFNPIIQRCQQSKPFRNCF